MEIAPPMQERVLENIIKKEPGLRATIKFGVLKLIRSDLDQRCISAEKL